MESAKVKVTAPGTKQESAVPQARRLAKKGGGSRAARLRRIVAVLCALVLVLAVAVVGTVGWIGSERAIHPNAVTYAWRLADYPNLRPQNVTFISRTGIKIAARFFPGRSHATIILSHGYGDNQNQMLPWANFLNRAGYSVLTYDMRDRGRSGGDAVTLGALEQYDLISAVDRLMSRRDVDKARIGALGVSLGGATTILAAAQDRRIKAVVDDCGFADAPTAIANGFAYFIHLPAFPFAFISVKLAEWRASVDVEKVSPVDKIGLISPRPIFIIDGLADKAVLPVNSKRNFAAAKAPKQIWWVQGAGHVQSRVVAGAQYVRRVVAFFRRYLGA
jgi:fermentation-respiration switch protein FrsA (DUF1100 family)